MVREATMKSMQAEFDESAAKLEERLSDADFLANRGLGNEVGFHIFCYDPALELQARKLFMRLRAKSESGELPCRIIERNLYDILIDICKERRILDAIPKQEEKRGLEFVQKQLHNVVVPESFSEKIMDFDTQPGDVLLITGVGEVYPMARAHVLLENLHASAATMPVIVGYPGRYNGQTLQLFAGALSAGINDGNFYRACRII